MYLEYLIISYLWLQYTCPHQLSPIIWVFGSVRKVMSRK